MTEKERLITSLVRDGYLKTPAIIEAFRAIDRKDFVLPEYAAEAYENYPLPIGHGQTISQPLTVAFLLELLQPKPGERILDVGAGSGWTSTLLAYIVASNAALINADSNADKRGYVVAVERIPELCKFGEANIRKYNFIEKGIVRFVCGDATKVVKKEAPFDKILSGAAAQDEIPAEWKQVLKTGGRIVAPIGQSVVVVDKIAKNKFRAQEYHGFSFVQLVRD